MATPHLPDYICPLDLYFHNWSLGEGKALNMGFCEKRVESEAVEGPSLLSFPDISHNSQNMTHAGLKTQKLCLSPLKHCSSCGLFCFAEAWDTLG